ncbi:META domain-containing protein [Hymenobacter sp. BT188]|uniref:META domain-containing protein n=1 Tax=Hymenobacter sp. BT188 TaxID=2763504 RepID=UPI001651417E|nr:META domain-containing protein [Hymenobacter sp. BT188]MBC6607699.1 META domain-containing protein [Hymenobacter sp. BT188]
MTQIFTRSFLWLAIIFVLGSCVEDSDVNADLLNKRWQLTSVGEFPILASSFFQDSQSYIQFEAAGNKLQGLSACDEIGGQFSFNAGTKTLTITQLTVKQGTCSSPVVGGHYLLALPQIRRYEQDGNTLRLYDATQSTLPRLTFRADD